ncbi:LCP family protein [Pseudokineococcus sp. 1T1Z-3]|uniref:LCP family protein n=1 Tax=Pseudokineococcus sp. 1T1Z-3 TaxID=3132745 RepID=UPI0030A00AC5
MARTRRRRVVALVLALAVLVVGVVLLGGGRAAQVAAGALVGGDVQRLDGVLDEPADEAADEGAAGAGEEGPDAVAGEEGAAAAGSTFLLVGSDTRGDGQTEGDGDWVPGAERSDVMVLGRVLDDGTVALVSLPRDSWVEVPGHGRAKLNAAYSWGGPRLLVETVQQETGLTVDRVAAVDFDGVKALTDVVGGVDVYSPRAFSARGHDYVEGMNHLDGDAALAFLRERYSLPRGDLDRVENQQRYLVALADAVVSRDTLGDPRRLLDVVATAREHVSVDERSTFSDLQELATAVGTARPEQLLTGTVPVAGLGTESGQSVVYVDEAAAAQLWAALGAGDTDAVRELLAP